MSDLHRMIDPQSIAIVGLSADPAKHGNKVLRHLRELRFAGKVHGVNPNMPDVDGVDMVAAVDELDSPPDLVICAVPAAAVTPVVERCSGVGGIVVFAGGFAESGEEGRRRENELKSAAAAVGVKVLGPNSGGIIRPGVGLAASFLTCLDRPAGEIRAGPVALITQSGGTGSFIHNLAAEQGSGLAISISTGNEADVRLGDAVAAAASLDEARVVVVVLETVRDGPGFVDVVRGCVAAGKPVVACRLGSGRRGQELMTTHTGAMAIPAHVLAGVLETLGVHSAETPGEAFEVADAAARLGPIGSRVGMVTHSGGLAILLSDLADRHRLSLPPPSDELADSLAPLLDHGTADNPLDMGGIMGGPSRFSDVVEVVASSGEYDVVLAASSAHPPAHTFQRVDALLALQPEVPVLHLWMAGDQGATGLSRLRDAGDPVCTDPRVAVRALATATADPPPALDRPSPVLGPLEEWGLPLVGRVQAASAEEAADAADAIGYPIVVKVESPDIAHKTEIGGVVLALDNRQGVMEAYESIIGRARRGGIQTDEVTVEPHRPGLEMIVGGIVDQQLGPLVSVGLGGVYTEALRDVVFAPAPATEEESREMIDRLRMRPLLRGLRGAPEADILELARIVSLLSRGVASGQYQEVEINPLVWDGEWVAVDWLAR